MKKRILAVFLAAALMCSFELSVCANTNISYIGLPKVIYQDKNYTILSQITSLDNGKDVCQEKINIRNYDVLYVPEKIQYNEAIPKIRSYAKTHNIKIPGLLKPVSITTKASVNQTSSMMIGALQSVQIQANSNINIENEITYQTYESILLDGGRTRAIKYICDIRQNYKNIWGDWTGDKYASATIIFEIYASGGSTLW